MMRKAATICILLALICSFVACSPAETTARGFSMGSDYYVTYDYDGDLDQEIADLFDSVESAYSTRVSSSLIARLNAASAGEIVSVTDAEKEILSKVFSIAAQTNYAFTPTILPLVKAWGFDPPYDMNGETSPAETSITAAQYISTIDQFTLYSAMNMVTKRSNEACLDLGAAMKGYAVGMVADRLREKSVGSALVYLGGTIAAVGRSYEIGVTAPRDSDESFAFRFTLDEGEICATSGDYERYYEYNGKRYHHIIDVNTGYPASSGVISATIVSSDGMLADAFATAVVVLGVEKGVALLKKYGLKGALVTEEKKVVTVGLTVTIKDSSYEIA